MATNLSPEFLIPTMYFDGVVVDPATHKATTTPRDEGVARVEAWIALHPAN